MEASAPSPTMDDLLNDSLDMDGLGSMTREQLKKQLLDTESKHTHTVKELGKAESEISRLQHQIQLEHEQRELERKREHVNMENAKNEIELQARDIRRFGKLLKHISISQFCKMHQARQAVARALTRTSEMNAYVTAELVDHQDRPGGAAYANAFELNSLQQWIKSEHARFAKRREKLAAKVKQDDEQPNLQRKEALKLASLPLRALLGKLEEALGMQDLNVHEFGERLSHWHETSNSFLERQMELLNDTRKKGGQLRHCMEQIDELEAIVENDKKVYAEDQQNWAREFRNLNEKYVDVSRKHDDALQLLDRKTRLIVALEAEVKDYKLIVLSLQNYIESTKSKGRPKKHAPAGPRPPRSARRVSTSSRSGGNSGKGLPMGGPITEAEMARKLQSLPYLKEYVSNLGETLEPLNANRTVWRSGGAMTLAREFVQTGADGKGGGVAGRSSDAKQSGKVPVRERIDGQPPFAVKRSVKVTLRTDEKRPKGIYPAVEVEPLTGKRRPRSGRRKPLRSNKVYSLKKD